MKKTLVNLKKYLMLVGASTLTYLISLCAVLCLTFILILQALIKPFTYLFSRLSSAMQSMM